MGSWSKSLTNTVYRPVVLQIAKMKKWCFNSSLKGSLSQHMESKNEEMMLQQLFKLSKCYSKFSQMKSYCLLFSRINNCFLLVLFKFFFFWCSPLSPLFSVLYISPLFSVDFVVAWWYGWKRAWVCVDLDLGVVVDGWKRVWVCRSQPGLADLSLGMPILA